MSKKVSYSVSVKKAGDADKIAKSLETKAFDNGRMLFMKKDQKELVVRILAEPKDWPEFSTVSLKGMTLNDGREMGFDAVFPLFEGYTEVVPEAAGGYVKEQYAIPVVVINEKGKVDKERGVLFYEPKRDTLHFLLSQFGRRKTLTDRDFIIERTGQGMQTKYLTSSDDPQERADAEKLAKAWLKSGDPDFADELVRMIERFMDRNYDISDDDDAEEAKPKKKATRNKAVASVVEEADDDADDDSEDSDAGEEDDNSDAFEAVFILNEKDEDSHTAVFVDTDTGVEYDAYLDRGRDDMDELEVGTHYRFRMFRDDEGDYIVHTAPVETKAPKKKKAKK